MRTPSTHSIGQGAQGFEGFEHLWVCPLKESTATCTEKGITDKNIASLCPRRVFEQEGDVVEGVTAHIDGLNRT